MDKLGPSTKRSTAAPPAYDDIVPYYAELCALSELRKKPGFGVPLRSGMGGHLLLYLNGVRVNRDSGYPVQERRGRRNRDPPQPPNSHCGSGNWR
jgi:hypothetical protein